MGTDVYLNYDGKKDDDDQIGYIRASIGMVNENFILRQIFPPECWELGENNFKYTHDLIPKLMRIGEQYLDAVHNGYNLGSKGEAGVDHGDNVAVLLKSIMPKSTNFQMMGGIDNLNDARQWLEHVLNHIAIGIAKAQSGLNPRVYISW